MAPPPAASQPAPKPKPGGGKRGLGARLTAKAGPLPVWAWAAVILVAYYLYTKMKGTTAATTTAATDTSTTATDPGTTDTSGGVGAFDATSFQAGLDANTASVDALAEQLMNTPPQDATPVDAGGPPGASSPTGPASTPTPTPPPASPAATGHLTQTSAGVLQWGGVSFTTKAAFNRWAAAHGTTPAKEFASHPQAKAIYSTLK